MPDNTADDEEENLQAAIAALRQSVEKLVEAKDELADSYRDFREKIDTLAAETSASTDSDPTAVGAKSAQVIRFPKSAKH